MSSKNRLDRWGEGLEKAVFGLTILFFLSVFISKAAMNSVGALLLPLSVFSIGVNRKAIFKEHPFLWMFLLPILCGAVAAFFSQSGGLEAVVHFLDRMKFFFLPLVFFVAVKGERRFWWFLGASLVSGVIASLMGIYHPEQRMFGYFMGMHSIGRTADMLQVVSLGLIVFLGNAAFRRRLGPLAVGLLSVITALFFWGLVMGSMRGTWLGFFVGLGIYALFFNRKFLLVGGLLVVLTVGMAPSGVVVNQFRSIGDTTSDESNLARLQLWKTGVDFSKDHLIFGSGKEGVKEQFKRFYYDQPEAYQSKYNLSIQYPGDFHNSYIQLFVEGGLLFFLVFIGCGLLLLRRLVVDVMASSTRNRVYLQAALVSSVGFLVTQCFHSELYSYGGGLLILTLYGGLVAPMWPESEAL